MKQGKSLGLAISFFLLFSGGAVQAQDPITEIIRKGIVKVIKAVDLKIQRMQNETLWLQNAQKAMENTLSESRLAEIADWVEKQRDLYQQYYEELWNVKSTIAFYSGIRELTRKQLRVVEAYKEAWAGVRKDKHFTPQELLYIGDTYLGILQQSLHNLQQVQMVVQSFTLQMTDGQRLELIGRLADDIDGNYSDLKAFNTRNIRISMSRVKDEQDISAVRKIYGLQ